MRAERLSFLAASALVFGYILLRAFTVPIVHDEAMAFFSFAERGSFIPFHANWDAGNHVLSTALGWAGYRVFGFHVWALRLPSVLGFLLYAAYAWKWGLMLRTPLVRRCLWAALLLMPFLLDFFSLFRGYGLAITFWSMALYELCALLERPRTKHLVLALFAMACATWCSLNLLALWLAVLAITAVLVPVRKQPFGRSVWRALIWLLLGVVPFLFAAAFARALGEHGALYYGNTLGVIKGSLASLTQLLLGTDGLFAPLLVLAVAVGCTGIAAWEFIRERTVPGAWAMAVLAALLWADCLGRVVLHHWDGTLYPEDRTALHWVPLFVLLFAFAADRLSRLNARWQWAALVLLVLPARAITTSNLRTTMYWPEQAIPSSIFQAAEREQQGADRLLTIGAYHQMPACWGFGLRERGLALNAVDNTAFPHGGEDLLLIDPQSMDIPPGYRMVQLGESGRVELLRKTTEPSLELVLDSTFSNEANDGEYMELWHPAVEALRGHAFLVQLDMDLHADPAPFSGTLIVEVDSAGEKLHYEYILGQFFGRAANSDSIHTVRRIPTVSQGADRAVVYLFNPDRQGLSSKGRLRVHLIRDGA
ncbi:MAG: hypothetical protein IPN44_11610 [Flavobacteriales bacterium]|nr:hypothetical protein [Flavobacteriales bacterium]